MEEMINDEATSGKKEYEPFKQMQLRHYSPLEKKLTPVEYIEHLLKKPGKLIYEINS